MRRWGLTIPLPGLRPAGHRELIGSLPALGAPIFVCPTDATATARRIGRSAGMR